jgi:bile acid:Na+ symporter, BASS family
MTIADLILPMLITSVASYVFTLGLHADLDDALYVLKRPALLLRAILSMYVIMVLIAVISATIFDLALPVKIAILALAISPIPPLLPKRQEKSGGSESYVVGLLVAAVVLSIILIPLSVELFGRYFHTDVHVAPGRIIPLVLMTVLAPLFLGILVRRLWPHAANRLIKPISLLSTILLVAGALPIIFSMSGAIWNVITGNGILALILFSAIGLAVGYGLGGPDRDNRAALALATSARHPGIALTIAGLTFPEHKPAVMALIACHLLIGVIIFIAIMASHRRRHATETVDGAS